MPATGTDWFSCHYVRIARAAPVMSSVAIPDPTLGSKPHRSDVVSAVNQITCAVLPRGGPLVGGHFRLSDGGRLSALADALHEFSDAEPLAVGKDCRSATPNPEVTNEGYVANYVKSHGIHQQFFDSVGLEDFRMLGQRTCEFAACDHCYSTSATFTNPALGRR